MCRRITCSRCHKPSWAGCGAHVEQVLGDVPRAERCACRETSSPGDGAGSGVLSSLRRLFDRKR